MGVCEEIHVLDHGETIAHGTPERDPQAPEGARRVPRRGRGRSTPEGRRASPGSRSASRDVRARLMRVAHPIAPEVTPADGAPLLELEDVRVAYGGIKALKGISLEVLPRRDRRDDRRERRGQDDDAEERSCGSCRSPAGTITLRRQERSAGMATEERRRARASRSRPRAARSSRTSPCARTSSSARTFIATSRR